MTMKLTCWLAAMMLAVAGCEMPEPRQVGRTEPQHVERAEPQPKATRQPVETPRREAPPEKRPAERTGNVTIQVEKILLDQRDKASVESAWRFADDHVVVSGGELTHSNGIRIGVGGGEFTTAIQAALERSRRTGTQKLMIVTLSGSRGSIAVGQGVYMETLRFRTPRGQTVLFERTFVGSSLVVEPTILPQDRLRVKLYPRFTSREGRTIDLTEMATEVMVSHGQPMVIGGLEESTDSAGFALFSWGREKQARNLTLVLTPYIEGAP
jgi:hypothetical protein